MDWLQKNWTELIGDGLKFLGIIAAAATVVWQMRRQHKSSLALQRENAKQALKLLIVEFESWSIAFPGLNVFQVALNAAVYDARRAFPPLYSALLQILPMDPPPGQAGKPTIIHPPPSPKALSELKSLIQEYKRAMDEIGCYIHDLTIEAQNNLLHGLFEERVPPRQPLDPRHKVISTDPQKAQELIRYFETATPWDKNQALINEQVITGLRAEASSGGVPK